MWIVFCGVGSALRSNSYEVDGGSHSYELDNDAMTCGVGVTTGSRVVWYNLFTNSSNHVLRYH